jgi:hypothetical protein
LLKQFKLFYVEAYPNPEALKGLTRTNEAIDKKAIHGFIAIRVTEEVRAELMQITPSNFGNLIAIQDNSILTLYNFEYHKISRYLLF